MKLRKRIISAAIALMVAFAGIAGMLSAYATTFNNIALDMIYVSNISGGGDVIWYTYTPEESGTYSFISYTTGKTVAYLYERVENSSGILSYNALAFADANDPDLETGEKETFYDTATSQTYTHTKTNFKLTYHLEKGKKYYFTSGYKYDTTITGSMKVRLTCNEYDNTVLESVTATSTAALTCYSDGEFRRDSDGLLYYWYNPSKVIKQMTVTITYKDGSTSSVSGGASEIDGYKISYNYDQSVVHWYTKASDDYTANTLTVTVGTVSCDYDVELEQGALYEIQGIVTDYITGDPVEGAVIYKDNNTLATTDSNGIYHFAYAAGSYTFTVKAPYGISRTFSFTVAATSSGNNHLEEPISIVIGDYCADNVINVKDYVYAKQNLGDAVSDSEYEKFQKQIGFSISDYPSLKI